MIPFFAAAAVLSSFATMPTARAIDEKLEPVGVDVKENGSGNARWYEMMTQPRKGYCIAPGWGRMTNEYSSTTTADDGKPSYIERLVKKDGKATLERRRFVFEPKTGELHVSPVASVALQEVAHEADVVVWAYREGKDVVLLTRAFDGGYDSGHKGPDEDGTFAMIGADGCTFAEARLDATIARAGSAAELHGVLPKKGKGKDAVTPSFTVYASLSRLSRDPEPTLAVRVRMQE